MGRAGAAAAGSAGASSSHDARGATGSSAQGAAADSAAGDDATLAYELVDDAGDGLHRHFELERLLHGQSCKVCQGK